ncbi:response regulator [Rhizobium leguminosarum]|uniref:Regulatory protein VirG n=1 Tax=Rhizobium leguminosarum TaxID=384 RepID=A0A444I7M7_RHILE|nr:response regulator [Rhizobium leguminosarum]RWX34212.1 response regulator [Rhizobium leguminosarum]
MKHIIIVDDDIKLRSLLIDYLSQQSFRVTGVKDSLQLGQVLAAENADLVVVDMDLGHEDGLEIVRTLSTKSDAPIIIVSGDRLEETDKVVGLELGAVDYVTKPFGLREFLARVRVALRARPQVSDRKERKIYSFHGWELNVQKRRLMHNGDNEIKLTAGEFNLLTAFLGTPRTILTREQLLSASRVHDEEIFDRSIDVLILRLRRKIEADPANPKLIITERGAGYIFDAEVAVKETRRTN